MLGLIKKDLLIIKGNLKFIAIVFVVFTMMAIQGEGDLSFIPAFISVTLFMSTFSYDEYNNWNAYAITLPKGRKNIVRSKYLATLILIFVSIVITAILSVIVGYLQHALDIEKIVSVMFGCSFAVILLQSIMYPIIFKLGIEKSRICLFVGVFGITGIVAMFAKSFKFSISKNILIFFTHYWMILLPIVMLLMLLVSYKISESIYLKKEF